MVGIKPLLEGNMENTFEFGKFEDELLECCLLNEPNFEKIEDVLAAGANVNAVNEQDQNLLERFYRANQYNGKYMPAITQRFIRAGFDVDRFGYSCIYGLVFSSYDRYIVDTAKILFHAGLRLTEKELDEILDAIGSEESYQRCCECDHACENIYYTFYELVQRANSGKSFEDVMTWQDCIGKTVRAVYLDANEDKPISILSIGKYAIADQLFFDHGDSVTLIEANPNIYGCAMPESERINPKLLDILFSEIIGAKFKGIFFKHREIKKKKVTYRQPVITVSFDNGQCVRFTTNFGEVPKDKTCTYFEFISPQGHKEDQ